MALDYTDRDFDSLRARMRNIISSVFPEWTDANVANFGNILVDMHAFVGDVLGKYQDAQARETRWSQAQLRQNLIATAALIGFAPAGASAATADEVFRLPGPQAADVTLPAGTKVSTVEVVAPVEYQLLEDLTIAAGEVEATASVENSAFADDAFTSSGLPNQSFLLSRTPFLAGSLAIAAGDGAYTLAANFLDSGPSSRHFTVRVDSAERARVMFGNGVNGAIPVGAITATYKTGGGAAGRVEAGRLKKIAGTFYAGLVPVTITVTNPAASGGGTDRQTNAQIRQRAPESVRVSDRAIAREDFEIVAKGVTGVSRALHLTENEDPGTGENRGIIYIVPEGGGGASQALLDAVMAAFDDVPTATTYDFAAQTANYLTVDVFAKVYLRKGVSGAVAKAAVVAALTAFFAPELPDGSANPEVDFGWNLKAQSGDPDGTLAYSDVYNAVRDSAGIRKVGAAPTEFTLNGVQADVAMSVRQFPKLGAVQLVDGDTGVTL